MKTKRKVQKHDSDTDSVSSMTRGIGVRNASLPILKNTGVSPLSRRRSLRIAALNLNRDSTMQDLTRQATVIMETPRVDRMETSNNFKHWRREKTLQSQKTIKEAEESSDEEMEHDLLREQTTSTDLQAALLRTHLKSSIKRKHLKRKATLLPGGPAPKKRGDVLNRQTSIKAFSELYVPPNTDWPLKIDGQVVWNVPLANRGKTLACSALSIDAKRCVLCDSQGNITELDANVKAVRSFSPHFKVINFASNKDRLLVASDKGRIYDITSTSAPEIVCTVKDFNEILDLCFHGDAVAISDDRGQVAMLDVDRKEVWRRKNDGETGWMVELDKTGVYLAHSRGVTKYDRDNGEIIWDAKCENPVLSGFIQGSYVYVASGSQVMKIDREIGKTSYVYNEGAKTTACVHCVAGVGGLVFASGRHLVCYDEKSGQVVYEVKLQNKAEIVKYFSGRLFCGDNMGVTVLDFTQSSIQSALSGIDIKTTEVSISKDSTKGGKKRKLSQL